MAFVIYPVTLTAGTNENVNDLNSNLAALTAQINGNLDTTNLSATAGVKESQLATGTTGLATGAFSAYRAAALSLATGAVVVFDTKEFDVSTWFSTANGRFTPLVAGYYRMSWCVSCGTNLVADATWMAYLEKNGAGYKNGNLSYQRTVGSNLNSVGTAIAQMNGSTDYVDVVISHNNGGTPALAAGVNTTFFQGELIGRS